MKRSAVVAMALLAAAPLHAQDSLRQDLRKGDYIEIKTEKELPKAVTQGSGLWKYDKVYSDTAYKVGLHIKTGSEVTMRTHIKPADGNAGGVIGAHGQETVVRYRGKWQGDGNNAYPNLVLSDGARFVFEEDSHFDLVMAQSFYTRQLWAYGDGTGTIELAEGFVADRTKGGTVPDACGTIRLNGVNLLTHHSRNLPFNTRPDGRGGVYPNGHIVWEGEPGSVWTVQTNPQLYPAQLDFHADGTIDTQQHLVHAGNVSTTSPKMFGGVFTSTGAFRTCDPDVTITKTGPAQLTLQGQQGYYPGATLHIKEGIVRMLTNPADGPRYDKNTGPYLTIIVEAGAVLHLDTPTVELQRIHMKKGSKFYAVKGINIHAKDGVTIEEDVYIEAPGAQFQGDVTLKSPIKLDPTKTLSVKGELKMSAPIGFINTRRLFGKKTQAPAAATVIEADKLASGPSNAGETIQNSDGRITATVSVNENTVVLTDIVEKPKEKKGKKKK